jgi:hypothetical protein
LAYERLASQLELARYTTELKPKLNSFKNSNEPSRAEVLTSEFERVCELRVFCPALPTSRVGRTAALLGLHAEVGLGPLVHAPWAALAEPPSRSSPRVPRVHGWRRTDPRHPATRDVAVLGRAHHLCKHPIPRPCYLDAQVTPPTALSLDIKA